VDADLEERLEGFRTFPVDVLDLSVRAANCLEAEEIRILGELMERTEWDLLKIRNCGRTSVNEIQSRLAELGLSLKEE
jgi:DNA-directed RNA polymerase subunit alpha